AGQVVRVRINDNEDVTAGQVLVELDPADYKSQLNQALSGQARAEAQLAQAEAQRALAEAQLEQTRAHVGIAQANASNTASDLRRYEELRKENTGAVSQQQLDNAMTGARSTAAQLVAAEKAVRAAEAQIGEANSQI